MQYAGCHTNSRAACECLGLLQDVTPAAQVEQDPVCDRTVVLYGYARGRNFTQGQRMHLAGVGDFSVSSISLAVVLL